MIGLVYISEDNQLECYTPSTEEISGIVGAFEELEESTIEVVNYTREFYDEGSMLIMDTILTLETTDMSNNKVPSWFYVKTIGSTKEFLDYIGKEVEKVLKES